MPGVPGDSCTIVQSPKDTRRGILFARRFELSFLGLAGYFACRDYYYYYHLQHRACDNVIDAVINGRFIGMSLNFRVAVIR